MLALQAEDATVTVVHSKTKDAREICAEADILIAAIGKAEMVKADWVKPGAAVIDVGTNPIPVSPCTQAFYQVPATLPLLELPAAQSGACSFVTSAAGKQSSEALSSCKWEWPELCCFAPGWIHCIAARILGVRLMSVDCATRENRLRGV